MLVPVLVALFGTVSVVTSGLVAHWTAKRTTSGTIETSAPSELWAEGKAIRDEYKAELGIQRDEAIRQRIRITELETNVALLTDHFRQCEAELLRIREATV